VQKPPISALLSAIHLLFRQRADRSKYLEIYQSESLRVKRKKGHTVNVDGEPVRMAKELFIKVVPLNLNIIVPPKKPDNDS
jgi:diacylglycerol kinase family enzyme